MTQVFHLLPRQLFGRTLYPLNRLKAIAPEAFEQHVHKYTGRQALLERRIPLLGCMWNDVLFFSPVHPEQIRDSFIAAGKTWKPRQWCIVDTLEHRFNRENTVIYYSPMDREKGDFSLSPDAITPFAPETLENLRVLPTETMNYYHEAVKNGDPIFPWRGIPHILYRGNIPLDSLAIIKV